MSKTITSFILTLIILFLLVRVTHTQQGWNWRNPLPQGNDLTSTKFLNNNTGYAVGKCGTVIKTTNGGNNWYFLPSGTTNDLNDCSFADVNTGYAVGYSSTVLKTTNGGINWISLNIGYPNLQLFSVSFISANKGIISSNGTAVFKTTNGGQNWFNYQSGGSSIFSIQMVDSINVYASGFYRIYKSTNGGINWSTLSGYANLYQINFADSLFGMTVANGGQVIVTTNAGYEWFDKSITTVPNLNSVYVLSQNTAWVCGYTNTSLVGVIFKTTNFGNNWDSLPINIGAILNKISFFGSSFGITVGNAGVISASTDGGNSWQMKSQGSINSLDEIQIVDSSIGFAVGFHEVLKSTNRGETWFSVAAPTYNCQSLYFVTGSTGYVGGTNYLSRTTDGGVNLINQFYNIPIPNGTSIYGLYFQNVLSGFAVCNSGLFLKTTNGGTNWSIITMPTSNHLFEIKFTSFTNGFIAGYNGTVLKTTNSGDTWVIVRNISGQHLYGISFADSNVGIAVGKSGLITKTINGGLNWSTQTSGTSKDLNAIKYLGGNIWIAAGIEGTVLFTSNGGNNWFTQPQKTKNNLLSISTRDSSFYIAGYYGTILSSSIGSLVTNISLSSSEIPKEFMLYQNYPNPFNPVTTIKFEVPQRTASNNINIQLKIFDLLGREIITLFDRKVGSGTYEVEWDASSFSSGIYFCRLAADDYTQVKKMVLLK
jgi:photosystem II stability/assembly factor-like uncharacterized protein